MSREVMVRANGADLCVQHFGRRSHAALLLISGASASMDWWEDDFCARLAAGRRFVIRYDLRDTGRSTHDEPGAPRYTGQDLVADAVGILDALKLPRAHLAGVSMGGAIAMQLALDHPDRVATLTLMSTSPGGPDLPPMSEALRRAFAQPAPAPDWSDRRAVIEYIVDGCRPFAGSLPFDEPSVRRVATRVVERTRNIASSMTNHWVLDDDKGTQPLRPRLGDIAVPTLVMHGTDDPLFPLAHGDALSREIPAAKLLPLQGMGHEVPPRQTWSVVIDALLQHTKDR